MPDNIETLRALARSFGRSAGRAGEDSQVRLFELISQSFSRAADELEQRYRAQLGRASGDPPHPE